jgi:hypothetical protein
LKFEKKEVVASVENGGLEVVATPQGSLPQARVAHGLLESGV